MKTSNRLITALWSFYAGVMGLAGGIAVTYNDALPASVYFIGACICLYVASRFPED